MAGRIAFALSLGPLASISPIVAYESLGSGFG